MAGRIVKTKGGKEGFIDNSFKLIDGKIPVVVTQDDKEIKLLCNPETLTLIGFYD